LERRAFGVVGHLCGGRLRAIKSDIASYGASEGGRCSNVDDRKDSRDIALLLLEMLMVNVVSHCYACSGKLMTCVGEYSRETAGCFLLCGSWRWCAKECGCCCQEKDSKEKRAKLAAWLVKEES
jgi:hypothetical protein